MCPKVRTGLQHGWACRVLRQGWLPAEDTPAASLSCVIAFRQWVFPLFQKLSTCFVHGGSYSAQPHYCPVNCKQLSKHKWGNRYRGSQRSHHSQRGQGKIQHPKQMLLFLAWPVYAICLFKVLRGQMRRCMSVFLRQMLKTNLNLTAKLMEIVNFETIWSRTVTF